MMSITNSIIKIENSEFYKNFTSWDECCEKLKADHPNITRTELAKHKAEYTKANQAPKKATSEEISSFLEPYFEIYKKDEYGPICMNGKEVFKSQNEFYQFLKTEFKNTGALFADSQLDKEFSSKMKRAVPVSSAILRMKEMLTESYDTSKNWTKIFLEHFGLPTDQTTLRRFQDFIKREITRLERTNNGEMDDGVCEMLVIKSPGGLGKNWIVSCLDKALIGITTPPFKLDDTHALYQKQTFPGFVQVEESIKNITDDELKELITTTQPTGRKIYCDVSLFDYCRNSYILITNEIQDTFKNMKSVSDTGLQRRFFIMTTELSLKDVKTQWTTDEMIEVCKNLFRECYKTQPLKNTDIYEYNQKDFLTYISKDNIIISRIKDLISVFIDESLNLDYRYSKRSFRLYVRLGSCPRDEQSNLAHFPTFTTTAIRNDCLANTEINRIFGNDKTLTLREIAQRVGVEVPAFDFSRFTLERYE